MIRRFLPGVPLLMVALKATIGSAVIVVPQDCPSVQAGLDKAAHGDTVYVLNGTYKENITLRQHVVLRGQDREKTILRAKRTAPDMPVIRAVNHAVVCNFTIEKGETGVLCERTNTTITNNILRNNKTGIHCLISLPRIRNNVIYRNKWTGIFCELIAYADNTAIEHNVLAENGYSGLVAHGSAVLIQNNIFFNNRQFGLFLDKRSSRCRIVHNDFFGNRRDYNRHALVDKTNTTRNPQFATAPGGGYDYVNSTVASLRGMGKNGTDIGLAGDSGGGGFDDDSDGDGVGGQADACPEAAEDVDGHEDEDGCPDFDNDFDGVYDADDGCPEKAEDFDGFEDGDGCPEPDNDGDGICDPWVKEGGLEAVYADTCSGSDDCPTVSGRGDDGAAGSDGCPREGAQQ